MSAFQLKSAANITLKPETPKPIAKTAKELMTVALGHQLGLAQDNDYTVNGRKPAAWWWWDGDTLKLDLRMGVGARQDTVFHQYDLTSEDELEPAIEAVITLIKGDDKDLMPLVTKAHQAMIDRLAVTRGKKKPKKGKKAKKPASSKPEPVMAQKMKAAK